MTNTAAKARLEEQLAELEGRQDRISHDLAEPLNPDSSEQAVEMEDDVSLERQAALIAREIVSIKRALMRIDNGTYGECVRCGAEIAVKRLEVRRRQHYASNAPAKNDNGLLEKDLNGSRRLTRDKVFGHKTTTTEGRLCAC